jgi:hypothetical protein
MIKELICEWLGHRWELYDETDNYFTYRCRNCGEVRGNYDKEFAEIVRDSEVRKGSNTNPPQTKQ